VSEYLIMVSVQSLRLNGDDSPVCQKEVFTSVDGHSNVEYNLSPQFVTFSEEWDIEEDSTPKSLGQSQVSHQELMSEREQMAESETDKAPNSVSELDTAKSGWASKSQKRKSRKAAKPPEDDDIFSFRRITEIVDGLHWVEAIFRPPYQFTNTLLLHSGRPRYTSMHFLPS